MSYPANAEQGQRMIDALSGNPVAPAGDVTKNRSPFNAEQAEVIIDVRRMFEKSSVVIVEVENDS